MRRFVVPIIVACTVAGCGDQPSGHVLAPSGGELTPVPEMSGYSLGEPILAGNLTVVPVVCSIPTNLDQDYATLAEAKKHGWIEIIEKPGREEVSRLLVRNTGPRPLLLLGGELLIGGKQDRVVAKDSIIQPGEQKEVEVYCVEHGRWTSGPNRFEYSGKMVPQSVRDRAAYKGQQEVWASVAEKNDVAAAAPSAGTSVRGTMESKVVTESIASELPKLAASLRATENVVGFVVAIDGEIKTLELFGSPALFDAALESLLSGFLAEAVTSKGGASRSVSLEACAAFIKETLGSRRKLTASEGGVNTFRMANGSGMEVGGRDYEAKAGAQPEGLIHGTYSNER